MLSTSSGESLECALHNSLTADVNPGAGSHLPVHRQANTLEAIELSVIVPLANEIRVGDENTRRLLVRFEFAHRFPRLDEKRFVVFKLAQRSNNYIESFPAPGGAAGAAIHHESIRILRDVGIKIVHQHSHRRFLMPTFATPFAAARRMDSPSCAHNSSSSLSKAPRRIASATRAISLASGRSCVSGSANLRTIAKACSTPRPLFN